MSLLMLSNRSSKRRSSHVTILQNTYVRVDGEKNRNIKKIISKNSNKKRINESLSHEKRVTRETLRSNHGTEETYIKNL